MKNWTLTITCIGCMAAAAAAAESEIARPDGVIYGKIKVDTAAGEGPVAVLARVAGFADPVAVYRVGDRPGHDGFVLHIPYALQRDGRTPSARTPAPGAAASLFVVTSDGREISAGSIAAPASGEAVAFDAEVRGDDLSPAPAAEPQLQGCGAGSGMCGSTGLITLALMFASLAQMKSRRRDIRRR